MKYRVATLSLMCFPVLLAAAAQIQVVDDLGRTVTLHTPARRIVSLAPSLTETVFALGAGESLVGVTDYCDYPKEAREKKSVGGIINPSIELIVSLKPDLILMSMEGNLQESFQKLTDLNIPVVVSNPRTFEGIYKSVFDLGSLTGTRESAGEIVASMKDSVRSVTQPRQRKPKTLFILSLQPLIVVGTGTYLSEMIQLAGGENVAAGSGISYPAYSREVVVASAPEVIILTSDIYANREALIMGFPEWENIPAFRTGRVAAIDANLISRPGPRVALALAEVVRLIQNEKGESPDNR
jgi:iron complex transport system substrate-binding protein